MRATVGLGILLALVSAELILAGPAFGATTHDVTLGIKDAPGIDDLSFSPSSLVIMQGDTVKWFSNSSVPHSVTSDTGLFDSTPQFNPDPQTLATLFGPGGFLLPGSSYNATLSTAGDYTYYCKIHPFMRGTITVSNQPAAPGEVVYMSAGWGSESLSFTSYNPQHLTVHLDTTVVWTNEEVYEPHTVTSDIVPTGAQSFDSSPNLTPQVLGGLESLPFLIRGGTQTFTYTFTLAGTFGYHCKLHPGMRGYVSVLAPTDLSKVNSDISGVSSRLDVSTILGGLAVVLGVIGTSISAAVWRRLPKKS